MIWGFIKGLLKVVAVLLAVVLVATGVALLLIETNCRPDAAPAEAPATHAIDDPSYKRTEANTYWTFPEWYIVYSFEDFGDFLESKSESALPYVDHIAGFWSSFCSANKVAAALPGNHYEYKQMIYVIGISYSMELAIKGLYENTIGRVTELIRGPTPTPEDDYAREVVQDYAVFLNQIPWYEYPFMEMLSGLWSSTPLVSGSAVRSIERKASLSAEYLVKAGYAKAIGFAAATGTSPWPEQIMFVVRGDVPSILAAEPDVELVRELPDGSVLLVGPRYRAFTNLLKRLADRDIEIVEIAGNRHILMTAIVPDRDLPEVEGSRQMFVLPMSARPGFSRVGFDLDVPRLAAILRGYKAQGVEVEHLYDY